MSKKLLYRDAFHGMVFSFIILFILSFIVVNLSALNPFQAAFKDFSFLDIYYSEKMGKEQPISTKINIVNLEHLDRFELALLLNKIQESSPKVIGVDAIFKDQKDKFTDSLLSVELTKENVINSYAFYDSQIVRNYPTITNRVLAGYSNLNFDKKNNVIRNFQGTKKSNDTVYSCFSTVVSKAFLGKSVTSRFNSKIQNPIPIKYFGDYDKFITYSSKEILTSKNPIESIKGNIVLLGYLGTPLGNLYDIEDKHFTPLNESSMGKSAPDMFGIVIHANIIRMLINDDYLYEIPNWLYILITLIVTYLALVYFINLTEKKTPKYMVTKKIVQLLFTIAFLWLSLYLIKTNIVFKPTLIIAIMLLSVEMIGFFKLFLNYLNKKFSWKSYFFPG